MVKVGKTNNEIARCLGISERQVRRLRARSGLNGFAIAERLGVGLAQLPKALERANSFRLAAQ